MDVERVKRDLSFLDSGLSETWSSGEAFHKSPMVCRFPAKKRTSLKHRTKISRKRKRQVEQQVFSKESNFPPTSKRRCELPIETTGAAKTIESWLSHGIAASQEKTKKSPHDNNEWVPSLSIHASSFEMSLESTCTQPCERPLVTTETSFSDSEYSDSVHLPDLSLDPGSPLHCSTPTRQTDDDVTDPSELPTRMNGVDIDSSCPKTPSGSYNESTLGQTHIYGLPGTTPPTPDYHREPKPHREPEMPRYIRELSYKIDAVLQQNAVIIQMLRDRKPIPMLREI